MKLHEIEYIEGARRKSYCVGHDHGSGNGKTVGKGYEGQKARSGGGVRLDFEGGQIPLTRRLPRRGSTNFDRREYAIVNVTSLNGPKDGTEVTPELLIECELIKKELGGIKVLGEDESEKRLSVKANKFSKSAVATIEQAGGKAEII